MKGESHFKSTPIAPPGSAILMQHKPSNRPYFGLNAKKLRYVGPYLNHYKDMILYTGGEIMTDTVKLQHHKIAIPSLIHADIILEVAHQLESAISQQPFEAPTQEAMAVKLLREVLLGERKDKLPKTACKSRRYHKR